MSSPVLRGGDMPVTEVGIRDSVRQVLLPLWLQQYMGYTATWAGLATAPVGILAILLSPWVGKNVHRIDPRLLGTVAFVGFGGVLWMRSNFNTQADFGTILVPKDSPGLTVTLPGSGATKLRAATEPTVTSSAPSMAICLIDSRDASPNVTRRCSGEVEL